MKHKHYEMIVAKAANMDLVIFYKSITGEWIIDTESNKVMVFENDSTEYFLCLPQHKEACLHWLNGGEVEYRSTKGIWISVYEMHELDIGCGMMNENNILRIKPKKEKRWIGVRGDEVTMRNFHCKDDAMFWVDHNTNANSDYWQFIEIEVEV